MFKVERKIFAVSLLLTLIIAQPDCLVANLINSAVFMVENCCETSGISEMMIVEHKNVTLSFNLLEEIKV